MAEMTEVLTPEDLTEGAPNLSTERLAQMITDAWELVLLLAPCVALPTFTRVGALRSIMRRAIYYDAQAAAGRRVIQSQTVGPISQSFAVNKPNSVLFTPNQEAQIAALCGGGDTGGTIASLQFDAPPTPLGRRW